MKPAAVALILLCIGCASTATPGGHTAYSGRPATVWSQQATPAELAAVKAKADEMAEIVSTIVFKRGVK